MSGTFSIARNYVKTNLPMRKIKDDSFGRQKMMKMKISAVCTLNLKGCINWIFSIIFDTNLF